MIGEFGSVDLIGLGNRNATINVNYSTDEVTLKLGNGNGQTTVNTIGQESDVDLSGSDANALWAALTEGQGTFTEDALTPEEEEDLGAAA